MAAKLTRKTMKVFGSSAGPNQLGVFGSLAAGAPAYSTDVETIQSLSNYLEGWYGAVLGNNSPAIQDMNALQYVYAYQLAYLFEMGVPEWDDGTEYFVGSLVSNAGKIYVSKTDNNLNNAITDTTNWKPFSTTPTGSGQDFWGGSGDVPEGWILADARTIGSAASGATNRANADTLDLYTLLWNNYSNTILVIQDSSGTPTTRGASAAADFAANKRLPVIDKRGRVSVGKDNMGGSAASRVTSTTMSPDGNTLGAVGGTQTHTLISSEMPSHTHTQNSHVHSLVIQVGSSGNNNGPCIMGSGDNRNATLAPPTGANPGMTTVTATNQNTGGDGAHLNMQPSIICNYMLKL